MPETRSRRPVRRARSQKDPAREATAARFFTTTIDEILARAALTENPRTVRTALEHVVRLTFADWTGGGELELAIYGHVTRQLQRMVDAGLLRPGPEAEGNVRDGESATGAQHAHSRLTQRWLDIPAEEMLILLWASMSLDMSRDPSLITKWLPSLGEAVH